jgi:hypothetical protein
VSPGSNYGSAAAGLSVSLAGDVNGDGLTDVIIGEPFGDTLFTTPAYGGGYATGNAFVVYGKTKPPIQSSTPTKSSPTPPSASESSELPFLRRGTGFSVSEAGDVDGDGLSDLVVGTPMLFRRIGPLCPEGRARGGSFRRGYASVVYSPSSLPALRHLPLPRQAGLRRTSQGRQRRQRHHLPRLPRPHRLRRRRRRQHRNRHPHPQQLHHLQPQPPRRRPLGRSRPTATTSPPRPSPSATSTREVAGLGLSELGLTVYTAEDPAGPWEPLSTTRDPDRNLLCGDTTHFSYFALGQVDDGDGVDATVEDLVPNFGGAPGIGDGNGDTIPDAEQPHVASFPNAVNGEFVTLEAPFGTQLTQIETRTAPAPLPPNTEFPLGLIGFHLTGNLPDTPDTVVVLLHLQSPPAQPITGYNKFSIRDGYIPFTAPIGAANVGGTAISPTTIELRLLDSNPGIPFTFAESGDADTNADVIYDPGGPTTGGPLLVSLASFTATTTTDGVRLEWTTLAEFDNAGFNLYRYDDGLQRLNATLIPAAGIDGSGAAYSYFDDYPLATGEDRLYYLEDVDLNGTRSLHGPISPSTTTTSVKNWDLF